MRICSILNDLGNYHQQRNQEEKALQKYQQAIDLGNSSGEDYYSSLCSRKAGLILLAKGKTDKGLHYLESSLEKGKKIRNLELIKNAHQELFQYYRQNGSYQKALNYYMHFSAIRDSLNQRKNNMRIVETQMDYELSKKQDELNKIEKQVNQLSVEKKLKEAEIQRQKTIHYFLIVIILLVIVAAILLYNRYRLKKKTNATKDKFFSIIAHDLRNPFNALYGLTDHISKNFEQLTRQEIHQFIDLIHESADQLLRLLENLLHWSRVQRGKIPFNPVILNLEQLIDSTLELVQINAKGKQLKIHKRLAHRSMVEADEGMLTAIMRNLLSNAIKFSWEGGKITIRSTEHKGHIQVEVADQGKGISRENQKKLFRVDESYTTSGTKKEKGTGLGLMLCKDFVEKHGGKIWVESEENKGSCFIFTLPIAQQKK